MVLPLFDKPDRQCRPLRPHQVRAMQQLRSSIGDGNSKVVCQLPTGAGKTRLAAEMVNGALAKGKRVCFTVPMISLVDQTVESFANEGINHVGVMQANHHLTDYGAPVQIASIQTLAKRGFPEADLVIVDECHIRFNAVSQWMKREGRRNFIGLSATPWARGMADDWDDLVSPTSISELTSEGYLSPFRVYAPSHPDLSGVKIVAGDYHEGQLSEAMSRGVLIADIVETWLKYGRGLPTLVFAVDRAHARKIQAQFLAAGIAMGYCDANVDLIERKLLFDQMARREIAGIVNIATLTTGVDADVRCIVDAKPTKSEMLHVQKIGRGLRTADGKSECIILDHADNHARLGFVTDIHHDKLLSGKDKAPATRKEREEPMPKECGGCGVLKPPKTRECPSCGFAPTKQSDIETEEGELQEITPTKGKPTMADKADFYGQILWIARERGRTNGWASHTYRDKFGVWPIGEARAVDPKQPTPEVLSFVKAKDIRFIKGRGARS